MKLRIRTVIAASLWSCGPSGCGAPSTPAPIGSRPALTAPANAGESTFLATVSRVDMNNLQHPYLWWVVTLKIDQAVSGPSISGDFSFPIHSPSQDGIKVGQRYKMTVRKNGDGVRSSRTNGDGYDIVSREPQD
jgi:hypothetical protein